MDPTLAPSRSQVVAVTTAPRPTPTPHRVHFSDALAGAARSLVRGAEAAMQSIPGASTMAVALRGGSGSVAGISASQFGSGSSSIPMLGHGGVSSSPATIGGANGGANAEGPGGTTPSGTSGDGGMESSLAQSQEMNMYYLQIQEAVNAQNRTYSALSNILKAEHDTVKTAIGNIR